MPRPRNRATDDPEVVVDLFAADDTDAAPAPVIAEPAEDLPLPLPEPARTRPVPESELTPDQRRIRELEDRLAREIGKKDPELELEVPPVPGDSGNILIHFLEDGLTALGTVWYRGQELEVAPGSPAYRDTCDRRGWSWLELRNDEFGQVEKYKKVMFRSGPWPGKSLIDAAQVPYESLKPYQNSPVRPPTEEELAAAAKAEVRRRRAAPRLPVR